MGALGIIASIVGVVLFLFSLLCGYIWVAVGRPYGQGVFLTPRGIPYVAYMQVTKVRTIPFALGSDLATPPTAWITNPYTSNSQTSNGKRLHVLPSWAFTLEGFR